MTKTTMSKEDIQTAEPKKENCGTGTEVAAEPAEAEKDIAAPATGKFKNTEALLKAYLDLEAEFTRRSQRLKELEENKAKEAPSPAELTAEQLTELALGNESVKNAVVREYLGQLASAKSVPLVSGGDIPAAPKSTPKSVREAGALATRFLNK